jgi:hypothetical protein
MGKGNHASSAALLNAPMSNFFIVSMTFMTRAALAARPECQARQCGDLLSDQRGLAEGGGN